MNKVTKEQYEFALARVEELLPLVDDNTPSNDINNKLRCPECGSHLVYPDSSGINDYACDACGCRWDGDDDDYDEDYDDDDED